jgi:hypothetical protein
VLQRRPGSPPSANECAKLEIKNNTSDINNCLAEYGWKGGAASCISLSLSADNKTVERGTLVTTGALGEFREEAARMWQGGNENVTLVVNIKNAGVFTFSEGGQTSDIIPNEKLDFTFLEKGDNGQWSVVLEADYAELGVSNFCLRLIGNISKSSSVKDGVLVKYTVLLFPMPKEELLQKFEAAQNAAWPGYQVMEGEFPLMVRATTAWGCPIMPLLLTGTSLETQPQLPSAGELRMAISAIMRNSVAAETSKSAKNLMTRWRKLATSPDELVAKKGAVEWPAQQLGQHDTGK